MKRILIPTALLLTASALTACQAVEVYSIDPKRYKPDRAEGKTKLPGVVYYEPEPYLRVVTTRVVDKDGKAAVESKADVIYLPNKHKAYAINSGPSGGNNTLEITLKDGWMFAGIKGTTDPQIDEGIASVAELIDVASFMGDGPGATTRVQLFHIRVAKDGSLKLQESEPKVIQQMIKTAPES